MKNLDRILVIAAGTCLGQVMFVLLAFVTWSLIGVFLIRSFMQ